MTTDSTKPQPEDAVARFRTIGEATVDLTSVTFATRYTRQGRPYVSDELREVEGFFWSCTGCGATSSTAGRSRIRLDYGFYLPNERDEARQDANAHAEKCRALPKPTT